MQTVLSYVNYCSNYNVMNISNIHNFHYTIMMKLNDTERKEFINNMRITIGNTYTSDFRLYIFKKIPESVLLNYF